MATHQIDSMIRFINSQNTGATGTLVQITRNSIVMEVYNPYSIVQLSEVLNDLCIRRDDRIIYKGRAVVSTLVNTGLYLIVSATLVDSWQDLSGLEQDSIGIREEAQRFLSDWESSHKLTPSFQLTVLDLRSLLSELNRWLEQVDLFAEQDGISHNPELTKELLEELSQFYLPILHKHFRTLEEEIKKIPAEQETRHRGFAQRDLHPLIMRSPFVWRTYNKPLGYAGDYEMVNMMLRDFSEGPTTYAKLVNILFLSFEPAQAHRNRIVILCERLTSAIKKAKNEGRTPKILNIGCGPAVEIRKLIKDKIIDDQCEITLLDFNDETLKYTEQMINKAAAGERLNFTYINKSVHTLLKDASRNSDSNTEYDMVYCAGLFDYLSDKVCHRLLRLFTRQTKQDGLTLVTNVHPSNPCKLSMAYLLEWHLIYRDEEGIAKLYDSDGKKTVYVDGSDVNIFMEIVR